MRYRWSRRAACDLRNLREYIADDDPGAAAEVAARIADAVEWLAAFPAAGRPGRLFGTRELVVGRTPYILIYQVRDDVIWVLRVLHGAPRWPSL